MKQFNGENMNRARLILLAVLVSIGVAIAVKADTGFEAATRVEVGSFSTSTSTLISTVASIVSASVKRPDLTCFNNTSTTLWIGPDNTTTLGNGFPVLSSTTFSAGAYSGAIFGVCNSGTCDVRCWAGKVQ